MDQEIGSWVAISAPIVGRTRRDLAVGRVRVIRGQFR